MDLQTFVSITSWIGICFSLALSGLAFSALVYLLVLFIQKILIRRLFDTYKAVSVIYYMGLCERHGGHGLKKELEKAKEEAR